MPLCTIFTKWPAPARAAVQVPALRGAALLLPPGGARGVDSIGGASAAKIGSSRFTGSGSPPIIWQ